MYTSWSIRLRLPWGVRVILLLVEMGRLLLVSAELLYVDSVLHLESLEYRRLVVLLTSAEFLYYACLLKLSLKLLECSFDVLTVFYLYNNHFCFF